MVQAIALVLTVLDLVGLMLIGMFFLRNGIKRQVDRAMIMLMSVLIVAFMIILATDVIMISGHRSPLADMLKILRPVMVRGIVAIPIWVYAWKCYRG